MSKIKSVSERVAPVHHAMNYGGQSRFEEVIKEDRLSFEEAIVEVLWSMREDCRNDRGIEYLKVYDDVLATIRSIYKDNK